MRVVRAVTMAWLVVVAVGCGGDDSTARVSGTPDRPPTTRLDTTPPTTTTTAVATTTTVPLTTTTRLPDPVAAPTSTALAPPSGTEPESAPPMPAFASRISRVTAANLHASWRPGCPVAVEQLRALDVSHWGFDGRIHTGRLILAANQVEPIVTVMADLYRQRFPIQRMTPIDVYGGDDNRSISANNTSAFNCRAVTGGTGWSEHAYGRAIDVNPLVNPYVKGSTVLPPEAAPYADRGRRDQGMIHGGDAVVQAFLAQGWRWGGYWSSLQDYQHFSTTGR